MQSFQVKQLYRKVRPSYREFEAQWKAQEEGLSPEGLAARRKEEADYEAAHKVKVERYNQAFDAWIKATGRKEYAEDDPSEEAMGAFMDYNADFEQYEWLEKQKAEGQIAAALEPVWTTPFHQWLEFPREEKSPLIDAITAAEITLPLKIDGGYINLTIGSYKQRSDGDDILCNYLDANKCRTHLTDAWSISGVIDGRAIRGELAVEQQSEKITPQLILKRGTQEDADKIAALLNTINQEIILPKDLDSISHVFIEDDAALKAFHKTYPLSPIDSLAILREECLIRSQKRMPIWRYQSADDLLISVQPQVSPHVSDIAKEKGVKQRIVNFKCRAVLSPNIPKTALTRLPRDYVCWNFELYSVEGESDWTIRCNGVWWSLPKIAESAELKERVILLFRGDFFKRLSPKKMLSASCMLCGKGLTDPASMARWIGPECAGTSSLEVNKIFHCD